MHVTCVARVPFIQKALEKHSLRIRFRGHELAVVAHRDRQLYCIVLCHKTDRPQATGGHQLAVVAYRDFHFTVCLFWHRTGRSQETGGHELAVVAYRCCCLHWSPIECCVTPNSLRGWRRGGEEESRGQKENHTTSTLTVWKKSGCKIWI